MSIFSIGNHIWKGDDMKCKCGFKFAGAGEFRNCDAFITNKGESGIICPQCHTKYVNGKEVKIENNRSRKR